MNVLLIPFFLVARVGENAWQHGPEYTFYVQLNAVAVSDEKLNGSVRLNMSSKLLCQPKGSDTLSCHFQDSMVNSFVSDSADPTAPGVPVTPLKNEDTYEMSRDQFEVQFNERGIDRLIVNSELHPRELDMIRAVVGQMSLGVQSRDLKDKNALNVTEKFTRGECETAFRIERKIVGRALYFKHGFILEPEFGLKEGQMTEISKTRNLDACSKKLPYFFGSAEGLREASDIESDITWSDARLIISATEFTSSTSNVIKTKRKSEENATTLYEHISVRLQSIHAAGSEPPEIKNKASAGIFVHAWLQGSSEEES